MSNRTHGIERKGTKLHSLAEKGLARRCEYCAKDFLVLEASRKLRPWTLDPKHCSQYCQDQATGATA